MTGLSRISLALLAASVFPLGCHGQGAANGAAAAGIAAAQPAVPEGKPLPPTVAFRIESLLRRKADLPPGSVINLSLLGPAKMPGFSRVNVSFTNGGRTSKAIEFLLSDDNKTLEQVTTFDIGADPRTLVPPADRPFRGGPATAPVVIVGFDDLECPFCARLHETIFPALTQRYGDKVHFVYRDFPLDQHPWAMRAAADVNCLAAESPKAYWGAVDRIHATAGDIGSDPKDPKAEKTMPRAQEQLDAIVREEAGKQKADVSKLNACIQKQDTTAIDASKQLAQTLNVQSTPTLFINGDKVDGAVPLEFLFGVIDEALRAENVQPPPPYAPPTPPAPPANPATKGAAAPAAGTTSVIAPTPREGQAEPKK